MTPEQIERLEMAVKPNTYSEWAAVLYCVETINAETEATTRATCARICRNLIANQSTSANISIVKDIMNLCADYIEDPEAIVRMK